MRKLASRKVASVSRFRYAAAHAWIVLRIIPRSA
jgi:hypothetical protein